METSQQTLKQKERDMLRMQCDKKHPSGVKMKLFCNECNGFEYETHDYEVKKKVTATLKYVTKYANKCNEMRDYPSDEVKRSLSMNMTAMM